nr:TOM1-like protein 2 [Tanacetum cinerariifolium]
MGTTLRNASSYMERLKEIDAKLVALFTMRTRWTYVTGSIFEVLDDRTVSRLAECKDSLYVVQTIAETATDDDMLLFEVLNLHNDLGEIISRCGEIQM